MNLLSCCGILHWSQTIISHIIDLISHLLWKTKRLIDVAILDNLRLLHKFAEKQNKDVCWLKDWTQPAAHSGVYIVATYYCRSFTVYPHEFVKYVGEAH